jgi:(2Fe-2S) ferredoxin
VPQDAAGWDVLVCRDCCCGSARKHRRTDHDGQLEALRTASAEGGGTRVLVSDCLDRCEQSNVVVLRPARAVRTAGGRPVWLGGVLTAAHTAALAGWLRRGGPASGPLPDGLRGLRLRPGR